MSPLRRGPHCNWGGGVPYVSLLHGGKGVPMDPHCNGGGRVPVFLLRWGGDGGGGYVSLLQWGEGGVPVCPYCMGGTLLCWEGGGQVWVGVPSGTPKVQMGKLRCCFGKWGGGTGWGGGLHGAESPVALWDCPIALLWGGGGGGGRSRGLLPASCTRNSSTDVKAPKSPAGGGHRGGGGGQPTNPPGSQKVGAMGGRQ